MLTPRHAVDCAYTRPDPLQALGRLELDALGDVKHGDVDRKG